VIAAAEDPPQGGPVRGDARLDGRHPLVPGRGYWLKLGTQTVSASVQAPKYVVDVNTQAHLSAKTLTLNDIGVAEVHTEKAIVFEPYADKPTLGGFILIDAKPTRPWRAGCSISRCAARRTSIGSRPTSPVRRTPAEPVAAGPVVHRPVGIGQVDDRQRGRKEAACAG
jgi:hypothetical protein